MTLNSSGKGRTILPKFLLGLVAVILLVGGGCLSYRWPIAADVVQYGSGVVGEITVHAQIIRKDGVVELVLRMERPNSPQFMTIEAESIRVALTDRGNNLVFPKVKTPTTGALLAWGSGTLTSTISFTFDADETVSGFQELQIWYGQDLLKLPVKK